MLNPLNHSEGREIFWKENAFDFGAQSTYMAGLGALAGWKFGWWSERRGAYLGAISNVTSVLNRRAFSNCWSERSDKKFKPKDIFQSHPLGWSFKCLTTVVIGMQISRTIVSYKLTPFQYKRLWQSQLAYSVVRKIFL